MKAILQRQPAHLLEADRSNEAKRLKSMDLSFEFGCSLESFVYQRKNGTGRCGMRIRRSGTKC